MSHLSQNTRKLALAALFVALDIIVTRFCSIQVTPAVRIGFQSAVFALGGFFLGPVYAAIAFVASDLLGVAINSSGGAIIPLFTVCAGLSGLIYGFVLHDKPVSVWRTLIAFGIHMVIVNLLLRTFALWMAQGTPLQTLFATRLVTVPINACVSFFVAWLLLKTLPDKVRSFTATFAAKG